MGFDAAGSKAALLRHSSLMERSRGIQVDGRAVVLVVWLADSLPVQRCRCVVREFACSALIWQAQ